MKLAREASEGLPVTIAATKIDGLVLSLTPFSHSYNYRSAVLFGYARVVEDEDEKLWGMMSFSSFLADPSWSRILLLHTMTLKKALLSTP